VRERGFTHPEIHDLGVLGPPRHLAAYAPTVPAAAPFIGNNDYFQSLLAERLHRIKDAITKYQT
jgi:hypothetical protein